MNIHMATPPRVIQIQIALPRGPVMNSFNGKALDEGGDNLTNHLGPSPCSTYEKEI